MKYSDLSGLSDQELVHKELSLERSLMGHLIRHRLGKLENTSLLGRDRRDIARVQTALTARESAAGVAKGSLKALHAGSFVPSAPQAVTEAGADFLKGMLDGQEKSD